MAKFIIETGQRHPGIKLYVCLKLGAKRDFELRGARDEAFEFSGRGVANGVRCQFSSLYHLEIVVIA